ncbi:MAG: YcdB/YcdC domain-containing protein [Deltaproteobacteria bacterium]
MRRFISLFLVVMMVFTVVPVSFAQSGSEPKVSLEKAIELAKSKLNIPEDDFNFNSNYNENNDGRKFWYLDWSAKQESSKSFNTSVTINADNGDIVNYNSYTETKNVSRIPKYTREQAIKAAEDFLTNIDSKKFKETRLLEKKYLNNYDFSSDTFYFTYVRNVGDIPYIDNYFNVFVNKYTLQVTSFQLEWDVNPVKTQQSKITLEQAKEIFKKKLGLELSYQLISTNGDYTKQKAVLVYSLKYGNKPIDAENGSILKEGYFYLDGRGYVREQSLKTKNDAIILKPEEQKAVDKTKKYITKEKAIEIAKKYLRLENGYSLVSSNLNNDYMGLQNAVWNFYWEYKAPKNSKTKVISNRYGSQSCSVDAVTGEIRSFYISDSKLEAPKDAKMKYNEASALKIADKYIEKIIPEKSKNFEFRNYDLYNQTDEINPKKYFYFNYVRKQGNAYCPFNRINLTVDAYSGIITNYSIDYYNVDLPAPEKIITLDEAYDKLFKELNFGLKYKKVNAESNKLLSSISPAAYSTETRLAYYLDNLDENITIDAKKGDFIDYNGQPLKLKNQIAFLDIDKSNEKEKIQTLVELGIVRADSDKFMPDEKIKQKDLIKLLVKTFDASYASEEDDGYYVSAYKYGILVDQNEKAPETFVTKKQMAKYFVRMMNLSNIAGIKGIYKVGFSDANTISEADLGYCAIANGLKIVEAKDNVFGPLTESTRAEAVGYIYNYLNVER